MSTIQEQKKKLFFVITKGVWGGAQKYVFDLAMGCKDTYDVTVVFGTSGILKEKLDEVQIKTIEISSLGRNINPLLDISSFFALYTLFKKEKPDIVHLNSSKIGALGALAGTLTGIKKIIFTAHGWAFNEDRNIFSKIIIWKLSWLTALFSTSIIVLGKKEYYQTLHMPFIAAKKVSLIRLGSEAPQFLEKTEARKQLAHILKKPDNFFDGENIIGTIAELHANKGLEYGVSAISELLRSDAQYENIVYIEIGGGELEAKLKDQITKQNLKEKIFLTGFLTEANKYLRAFDIFLLPSIKEGLPYVLIEAGFAQVPIVATRVGAIPEIITHERSGLLCQPKDIPNLAQNVKVLIDSSELREVYSTNFKKYCEENLGKEKMIRETGILYKTHS